MHTACWFLTFLFPNLCLPWFWSLLCTHWSSIPLWTPWYLSTRSNSDLFRATYTPHHGNAWDSSCRGVMRTRDTSRCSCLHRNLWCSSSVRLTNSSCTFCARGWLRFYSWGRNCWCNRRWYCHTFRSCISCFWIENLNLWCLINWFWTLTDLR